MPPKSRQAHAIDESLPRESGLDLLERLREHSDLSEVEATDLEIRLRAPTEVDGELLAWLGEAYALSD